MKPVIYSLKIQQQITSMDESKTAEAADAHEARMLAFDVDIRKYKKISLETFDKMKKDHPEMDEKSIQTYINEKLFNFNFYEKEKMTQWDKIILSEAIRGLVKIDAVALLRDTLSEVETEDEAKPENEVKPRNDANPGTTQNQEPAGNM